MISTLSSGESLLYSSFLLKRGVFSAKESVLAEFSSTHLSLFDGQFLYPLGNFEGQQKSLEVFQKLPMGGALGSAKNIRQLQLPKQAVSMKKIYAELPRGDFTDPPLEGKLTFCAASSPVEYRAYCEMVHEFVKEESGLETDIEKCSREPILIQKNRGFLAMENGNFIGMVSSKYQSEDNAMINMLYIRPQFRGRGYGKALLVAYIKYLFEEVSEKVSLFYSPENESAKNLYTKLGFLPKEDWSLVILRP